MTDSKIRIKDKRGGRFIVDDVVLNGYGKMLGPYGIAFYIALCRHANMSNQQCWPSQETIAEKTGMSRMQVNRMANLCEEIGLIARETIPGKYTIYTLLEPKYKHWEDNPKSCNYQLPVTPSDIPVTDSYTTSNSQLHKGTKEGTKEGTKYIYSELLEYWNSFGIVKHKSITEPIRVKIRAKLKEKYTIDEIKQAIKNYAEILEGNQYYFKYKWTLKDFLQRGFEKFADLETAKANYRRNGNDGYQNANQAKTGKYDDVVER